MAPQAIVVTGSRVLKQESAIADDALMAREEAFGDLKLYRVPERVTVAAKGLKQIAFLDKDSVRGKLAYAADCSWPNAAAVPVGARMRFETFNDAKHGLGVALPMGGITFFEPSSRGELFVGEQQLRDYAAGQDVEIPLGQSAQVFATCERMGDGEPDRGWAGLRATLANATPRPVTLRLELGSPIRWHVRGLVSTRLENGQTVYELTIPANAKRDVAWQIRSASAED
jgi:hypothetical protein